MQRVPHKLITGILPKGVAPRVLRALKEERGIQAANIHPARGVGRITPLASRGLGGQAEREILTVVVAAELAEEIFEFIHATAEVNRPHGGIMFMCALAHATPFILPDLPEES